MEGPKATDADAGGKGAIKQSVQGTALPEGRYEKTIFNRRPRVCVGCFDFS